MKCVVPGPNLKIFGRCIHSLGKIGDEIYFEAKADGMSIGTVNSSRCAYMNFFFRTTFFQKFSFPSKSTSSTNDPEDSKKCKVYTKSCLAVFKSLTSLEKSVDKCVIMLDLEQDRFIFQLKCRHGLTKTYNLTFIESERLEAVFNTNDYHNNILVQSKLFAEVVNNFQPNTEELSLHLSEDKILVTNHAVDADSSNMFRTEVELLSEECDNFNVTCEMEMIFCLKELRALLFFCESPELQFTMHVKEPGEPIVFVTDSDPAFEVHLVLATVFPSNLNSKHDNQSLALTSKVRIQGKKKETKRNSRRNAHASVLNSRDDPEEEESIVIDESRRVVDATVRNDGHVENEVGEENEVRSHSTARSGQRSPIRVGNPGSRGPMNAIEPDEHADVPPISSMSRNKRRAESSSEEGTPRVGSGSGLPPKNKKLSSVFQPFGDDESGYHGACNDDEMQEHTATQEGGGDDDDDIVPGTPPSSPASKRFRALFFGLSQSQNDLHNRSQSKEEEKVEYEVLAEDSDPES